MINTDILKMKESVMPFIPFDIPKDYLTEIIGAVLVVLTVIIYFLTKKSKSSNPKKDLSLDEQKTKQSTETEEEQEKELENSEQEQEQEQELEQKQEQQSETELLSGKEEGSFGAEITEQKSTPKKKEKRKKKEVPPHAKITKENFKEFAGIKILVAEDNLINQKVISGLLAETGINITIADDGQDALDVLKKNSDFDFILMDAHMPRIDGFEATRQIRQNPDYDDIIIVALSGDTATDDIKKMHDAGMDEHLEKPLKMEHLYNILYAYTGNFTNQNNDDFVEIVMTKELNGDKGLQICGGDEAFYNEILSEFQNTYNNSAKELENMIKNKDIANADKLLLDIVGITANIGAENLHNIAKNLKEAIQNTQEKNYMNILNSYKVHLNKLLHDIKEINN